MIITIVLAFTTLIIGEYNTSWPIPTLLLIANTHLNPKNELKLAASRNSAVPTAHTWGNNLTKNFA